MNQMHYEGYVAQVTLDVDSGLLHGRVMNTRDVITFEAKDVAGLRQEFERSIQDYRNWCQELGQEPERPYSGKISLRVSPALHRQAFAAAAEEGASLNRWIEEQIEKALSEA